MKVRYDKRYCDICEKQIINRTYYKFKEVYASFNMGFFQGYWGAFKKDMCEDCMKNLKKMSSKENK